MSTTNIPPVTIVIEWENAIDVEDHWTDAAMAGLASELKAVAGRTAAPVKVVYLYDETAVDPGAIRATMARAAPDLADLCALEILPTPGLTYYQLKNFGVARSTTELTVMLDSDAGPQPGWLEGLLAPFADPEMMVVGGFTTLGHEDLLSRTMALAWIFDLPDERERNVRRKKVYANNCAVRTDFFNRHPFPDLPKEVFKKACGFWLRDLDALGHRYIRTADALTIHAPHPGYRFIAWRGWASGTDRDYVIFQERTRSRSGRIVAAAKFTAKRLWRAWKRIVKKGAAVGIPAWQRPFAMLIALGYFTLFFLGESWAALTRSYPPLKRPSELLAA